MATGKRRRSRPTRRTGKVSEVAIAFRCDVHERAALRRAARVRRTTVSAIIREALVATGVLPGIPVRVVVKKAEPTTPRRVRVLVKRAEPTSPRQVRVVVKKPERTSPRRIRVVVKKAEPVVAKRDDEVEL